MTFRFATSRRGFTVLELLLASGIAAIVMMIVMPSLLNVMRVQRAVGKLVQYDVTEGRLYRMLHLDLQQAVRPRGVLTRPMLVEPVQVGSEPCSRMSLVTQGGVPYAGVLKSVGRRDLGRVEVRWEVEENMDGTVALVRYEQIHLLASQEQPADTYEVMFERLAWCRLEVWDEDVWLDTWDSESRSASLPRLVRLRYALPQSNVQREVVVGLPVPRLDPAQGGGM